MAKGSDFYSKVYKAVGKRIVNDAREINMMTAGVLDIGNKAARKAFRKVDYSKLRDKNGSIPISDLVDNIVPFKLKKELGIAAFVGLTATGAIDGGMQVKNRRDMGEISGGQMANMINANGSLATLDEKERNRRLEAMNENKMSKGPLNTYGAEGDIVFALHNLR